MEAKVSLEQDCSFMEEKSYAKLKATAMRNKFNQVAKVGKRLELTLVKKYMDFQGLTAEFCIG